MTRLLALALLLPIACDYANPYKAGFDEGAKSQMVWDVTLLACSANRHEEDGDRRGAIALWASVSAICGWDNMQKIRASDNCLEATAQVLTGERL